MTNDGYEPIEFEMNYTCADSANLDISGFQQMIIFQ